MKPVRLAHAKQPLKVARDAHGVPHIWAPDWSGALYGLGYLQALDRRTQLLFSRVVALGRSAELLSDSPGSRERDRFFRRAGLYLDLTASVEQLNPTERAQLQSFCDGVNDGLLQAGRSLPMWAVGFRAEPWNPEAVLLLGKLLSYGGLALGQQRAERVVLELILSGVNDNRLRELYAPHLDGVDFDLLRQLKTVNKLSDAALAEWFKHAHLAGSNAWAVSPQRSATGTALLASDPHLDITRLPAVWYEAVLHWEDRWILGATLPGTPMFAVGRHDQLAWGVTYAMADTSDCFVEDCRVVGDEVQYRRGDTWRPFAIRTEELKGRKQASETLQILFNEVGTLEADPRQHGDGYYVSQAWTGHQTSGGTTAAAPGGGRSLATWLGLPACTSTAAAMDFVRACPQPPLCWLFADSAGHIGSQICGDIPLRRPGHSGIAPIPAWQLENHWQGLVPNTSLPRSYDPACGYLSAANENWAPKTGGTAVTFAAAHYRARRIEQLLATTPKVTLADCRAWQYDSYSLQAEELLTQFGPYLSGEVQSQLQQWDRCYAIDSRGATLFQHFYQQLLREVFGQPIAAGGLGRERLDYLLHQPACTLVMLGYVDRILHDPTQAWWSSRDVATVIADVCAEVNQTANTVQPWGAVNLLHLKNAFISPGLGKWLRFHALNVPLPGCHATLHQGHLAAGGTHSYAPSYHFVTDLGTAQAETNLPAGVSERRFSQWYLNELPRWRRGEYKVLKASGAASAPRA